MPRSSRRGAACRDVLRVQPLSEAFCRSTRHYGIAPLKGVVHFKPSRLLGRTGKFCSLKFDDFLGRSHSSLPKKDDDGIAPYKAVPLESATVCSTAYSNPIAVFRRSKAVRFIAAWRHAAKLCFRPKRPTFCRELYEKRASPFKICFPCFYDLISAIIYHSSG